MTTQPLTHSIVQIPSEALKALPEELQPVSREWLEERHVADTQTIEELKAKLLVSEKRGDEFIYKMLAAQRKQIEAEALAANRLTEIKRQDELLIRAHEDERLLFLTMAKLMRVKRECAEE